MNTALIIHGLQSEKEYFNPDKPSPSNSQWLPWVQNQLNIRNILTQTPEMPRPYAPNYKDWKHTLERFDLNENTILIGHSLGAGFILRWLSEHQDVSVGKVALVAPWVDTEGRLESDFFSFDLAEDVARRCKGMTVLYSDNDMERIELTVALCKSTIKDAHFVELKGKGHFLKKHMGTDEFPELLGYVVG